VGRPDQSVRLDRRRSTTAFGAIGFADDYLKIVRRSHHGLRPATRWAGRSSSALAVGTALLVLAAAGSVQHAADLPVLQALIPDLGWAYVPFATIVLVGATNAVNLTDGLDGLAISTFAVSAAAFTALAYVSRAPRSSPTTCSSCAFEPAGGADDLLRRAGRREPRIPLVELVPAEIFMGDVGSLALGGALGTVAILIKQELLLVIVGGVFVLEALSVIIQVASFKLTGRRVFKMAPLHHHFELVGWSEPKVIARFLIAAIVFALFSLTTLKLR
jgi:phospho-N-acetylmuramoyl-pentapeptide-transferase